MSRQILTTGTIACSALLIYSWAQPSASEPTQQACEPDATNPPASATARSSQKACPQTANPSLLQLPEQLFNLQWGKQDVNRLPDSMEALYEGLISQAQAAASNENLTQAMAKIAGIPKNSRHYAMAQQLREDWSRELLRQATNLCQQAKVSAALSMLTAIPATSQSYSRATELRQRWQEQAERLSRAIAAKEAGDWQAAIDAIESLAGTPLYNSLSVQELLQQAMTQLYEPDANLLNMAMSDLPMEPAPTPIASPESVDILPETIDHSDEPDALLPI